MPTISANSLLHIARSGLLAQQATIDVVANNIANLNTIAFKQSRADFQELLNTEAGAAPDGSSRAFGQAAGTTLAGTQRLDGQGQILESSRPWDLAIDGAGFFQIRLPDGSTAYTRDGTFRLDSEGRLTTAGGNLVLPAIALPPDAEESLVSPDGTVMVRRAGSPEPQPLAVLTLARFANPSGLESIGNNLYRVTPASGPAQTGQPGTDGFGQIRAYGLEASNVNLSQQITDLIGAQRAYSMVLRALETADEMVGLANQMRL